MTKVFHFKGWDSSSGSYVSPPLKSTLERIKMIRCEIIDGTMEEVAESNLDIHGRYIGVQHKNVV
jgi:hypothetical protein